MLTESTAKKNDGKQEEKSARSVRILVVEPHWHTQELLHKLLTEHGFDAVFFLSGQKALRQASLLAPDLILLEINLKGEDGLAVCRGFREKWPGKPIVVLTEVIDSQTRLEAISCGAVDYLTKPYNREYLLAKINSLLAVLRAEKEAPSPNPLAELFSETEILRPATDSTSPFGYTYPQLTDLFGMTDPEEQREFLENETAEGRLQHVIFDVVKRCPQCHSINVNFRQVCPHCLSPAIKARPVNGTSLERPYPQKEWVCVQCNHVFSEPKFYGRCLSCGRHFEESEAENVVVYSYVLRQGEAYPLEKSEAPPSELQQALADSELPFETEQALVPLLRYELRRSKAAGTSFSVLILEFLQLEKLIALDGSVAAKRRLRNALLVVGKVISPADQVVVSGANRLWILMPDTPHSTALMVRGQLESYLERLNLGLKTSLALFAFPEGFQSVEELLKKSRTPVPVKHQGVADFPRPASR